MTMKHKLWLYPCKHESVVHAVRAPACEQCGQLPFSVVPARDYDDLKRELMAVKERLEWHENEGTTHHPGCWRYHKLCAIQRVEELVKALKGVQPILSTVYTREVVEAAVKYHDDAMSMVGEKPLDVPKH